MKIALCSIIKDDTELPALKRMIKSIEKYVDEMNLVANGEQISETEAYCKEKGINYSYLKWNDDFSEQRNHSFSMASKDVDYIIWLDADDVLVGGKYLRTVARISKEQEYHAVFLTYWYGCSFDGVPSLKTLEEVEMYHQRERLIKPDCTIWKKRIHETPVHIEGLKYNYTSINHLPTNPHKYPIAVLHTGSRKDANSVDHMDRNQRLLELELEDERKGGEADPRTILYLMKIYSEREDINLWRQCIGLGQEYLSKSGWDEERGTCYMEMAKCMGKLKKNKEAVQLLMGAVQEWPYEPLLYLMLAESYYNLGNFGAMKHWMSVGLQVDNDRPSGLHNDKATKVLASELMVKLYFNGERNIRKAYQSAEKLYQENPTDNNAQNLNFLYDLALLDEACEHTDKLVKYFDDIGDTKAILRLLESLPDAISQQLFATKLYQKYSNPRRWGEKEIAYIANFGGKHFEEWSGKSLNKGIGGSETAIIELSKEWAKLGYKVTVFGDPGNDRGNIEGVTYLPWYCFNPKDKFHTVIQWRSNSYAGKISCKRFLVDLHDIYHENDFLPKLDGVDKIMVKSQYHRLLAPNIPNEMFGVISNGIRT